MGIVFWIFVLVIAAYGIMLFNGLVNVKNNVAKAWANIDVLLKQRHDELPKLIDTCKQYMQYEQATLEKVMQARSQVSSARESQNLGALGAAESTLRSGLGSLFALAESYPELKANAQFLHLQTRITGLENAISDRREFYNDSVTINNTSIEQFPGVLLAKLFNFKAFDVLKFAAEELKDIDVGARFK
jgi:LemA protein